MTMRKAIIAFLRGSKATYTATQLRSILMEAGHPFKLSSLSSLLKKLVNQGTLERQENFGPRKGYDYRIGAS